METVIKLGLQVAGLAQLLLCVVSVAIPRCLQWNERTACLIPFIRQMFYTYALYVLGSHFFFAVISLCFAEELLTSGPLGSCMLGFMGVWWTVRIICQFFFFDREGIPNTPFNKVAEGLLVLMFFCLVAVYWGCVLWSLTH